MTGTAALQVPHYCKMPGSLRLQSARCDILPMCREERQVSSSISNAASLARRTRLMTESIATVTGSVLEIQYLQ